MKIIKDSKPNGVSHWQEEMEGAEGIPTSMWCNIDLSYVTDMDELCIILGDNLEMYRLDYLDEEEVETQGESGLFGGWYIKRFICRPNKWPYKRRLTIMNCARGAIDTNGRSIEPYETKEEALRALENESVRWSIDTSKLDERDSHARYIAILSLFDVLDEIEDKKKLS